MGGGGGGGRGGGGGGVLNDTWQSQLLGGLRQSSKKHPSNVLTWRQVDRLADLSMKLLGTAISQLL